MSLQVQLSQRNINCQVQAQRLSKSQTFPFQYSDKELEQISQYALSKPKLRHVSYMIHNQFRNRKYDQRLDKFTQGAGTTKKQIDLSIQNLKHVDRQLQQFAFLPNSSTYNCLKYAAIILVLIFGVLSTIAYFKQNHTLFIVFGSIAAVITAALFIVQLVRACMKPKKYTPVQAFTV